MFRDIWDAKGHDWIPVELDAGEPIPELEGFDMLAVMGGPMDVWQEDAHPWLKPEKAAIRRWVRDLRRPYFGVCLGHQLLADALGGRVTPMDAPEVGLARVDLTEAGASDPIFDGFPRTIETLQWHGCEVSKLPEGAVALAANAACAVQAMRWGDRAYGFQSHSEITPQTTEDWTRIPEYRASLEQALGAEAAAGLGAQVEPKLPAFRADAERLDRNFAAIVAKLGATV